MPITMSSPCVIIGGRVAAVEQVELREDAQRARALRVHLLRQLEGVRVGEVHGDRLEQNADSGRTTVLHCPDGESPPGLVRPPKQAPGLM